MSGRPDSLAPVEVIAEAAQACPAVAGLHGGRFGQHTTYLPGRRVAGVTVSSEEILVGVVGCYPASVIEIASQVRAAVGALVPGVPVTVIVEDLLLPGERLPAPAKCRGNAPIAVRPPSTAPPAPPEKERFS